MSRVSLLDQNRKRRSGLPYDVDDRMLRIGEENRPRLHEGGVAADDGFRFGL